MSSSGYDRLYHQFKDINEEEYLIQIYRSGVLPTSYQIKYSDANPVQLSYGGGDKNSWDHTFIQGRELVFKFYVPRADIAVIDDLLESQYKEWYVEFSKGGVTLFLGYLKPENMYKRFEINPPYIEVELSATDGLAELKDIDFTLPGINPIKDEVTLLEAIKNALTPVNIFLPFKIQVNTFPSEFTGYTLTTCSISESYCNVKRFYNITIEDDEEIVEPIKCWDVIEYCLKTFNCKLFQHKGYYTIVNHLELVKNSNSLTHIYDWNNIITPTSSTLETDVFKDISSELYTPYVEQQKIHPLRSITSTIINTNAGESVGIDFTDWENVWEFSNDAEMHWASRIEQADGSLRCLIEDTDQPWMRLKTTIHIVPEDGKTTYLRFKGEFYCWFWNKWDGNIFKSDGKLSQTDIKIRVQKDNFWSPYLSLGTPIYSPDVNGVQVPKYITFDTKNHINLLITKEGDYNFEFFVDSLRGAQQFDALGIQLRNFEITIWDGAGNEYNPTNVNSKPTYYQVNIENNGFEDLEQELQLFDGVSTADSAALMMRKGGVLYLTQYWDRRGGADERKIIDINSIYILNNRMIYKNFLRCTIIDRTFQIDFEHILIIQSKYYTFSSYTRNFRTGDIEAELIELIHDSRAYPAITEATKTATIIEPLTPGTDEAEQLNIAVLKSAPITQFQVGDVIRAVEDSSGIEYYLAQADSLEHATAIGIVTEIVDTDIFKYISNGYVPKEIFPCEVGQYYWLSPTEAGKMVTGPTYKEYEIEQAIGFGTEKGFYVEIDARNLNFKEIVETLQIPGGIDDIYVEPDPVFPIDYLYKEVDSVQTLITDIPKADGVVAGGHISWLGGLQFQIDPTAWYKAGDLYTIGAATATCDPADPSLPRIDVLALNTDEQFIVVKGTPSANPYKPTVDPLTQIELTEVYIAAGATEPDPVPTNELVYNENVEWVVTASGVVINADYTGEHYQGSKSIEVGSIGNYDYIQFEAGSGDTFNVEDWENIIANLKLKANLDTRKSRLAVVFLLDGVAINNPTNFDITGNTTNWQNLALPFSRINFFGTEFNQIRFYFYKTTGGDITGFYLDYIKLEIGIEQPVLNQSVILTGDVTGSGVTGSPVPTTLATVNSNVGTFGDAGKTVTITVDGKGRITAVTENTITAGLTWVTAPATKTSTGTAGQIAKDANYLYICTATNTWKRIAMVTNWV